jgi:hypothetical protein
MRTYPEERSAGSRLEGAATERALPTGLLHDFVRGPSFETAALRPPQDEVVDWNIVKVGAQELHLPAKRMLPQTGTFRWCPVAPW